MTPTIHGAQTGAIQTHENRAQKVPTSTEGKQKERSYVKKALQTCGYPKWTFIKPSKRHSKKQPEMEREKQRNVVIPYMAGLSEKFRRIFQKHKIQVNFKPGQTLRQRLVHPKEKTPRYKLSNVVYAVQCT